MYISRRKFLIGMIIRSFSRSIFTFFFFFQFCTQSDFVRIENLPYELYPEVNELKPNLPSPFISEDNDEYVVAVTKEGKYAIMEVTLSNEREICDQLIVDTLDFPELAKTGLHAEDRLNTINAITGWDIDTITGLGRPKGLSYSGFLADDESIMSVIRADDKIIRKMNLSHPRMAKPLFQILNMMDTDLSLNRWNMARHNWENISYLFYNENKVFVHVEDTKGGQKSIFNDSIEGGFYIKIWCEFSEEETEYLKKKYGHLEQDALKEFKTSLSTMNIGEIQPQYIMRYGFYEGHTFWRACHIAISFIFGIKSLEELDETFDGGLNEVIANHYTR